MDFERTSSGLPGLDRILDGLRLGDNVVWQVDSVDDYRYFARPFAENALRGGKRLVYLRFGQHPPILPALDGMSVHELQSSRGFERFSTRIREIATREGEGVYYVFDCLSELLSEWSTDLMIGNFFLVTCPYLFQLRTVAYFAILRDRHSYQTIARIRDTTQLLLDVYHQKHLYVHPLKVWQRYSPTMFLPHTARGDDWTPLTSSADAAQLLSAFPRRGFGNAERKLDHWDHIFLRAADLPPENAGGGPAARRGQQAALEQLLKMVISRDDRILALARKYLTIEDLLQIKSRLLGSGFIGGKAVGFLLARKILALDQSMDWSALLEPHDSFYIGSDVYYTYLVENGCWELWQEHKREESYLRAAAVLREKIATGVFPPEIRDQLAALLEYYGQSPIIIRSSSLLEDGFGNAFAGKYESVFSVNQGDPLQRLDQLTNIIRTVYASAMSEEALAYRLQRGLAQSDEQMALLVQRVSGAHHGSFYFPDLAGVAFSHNLYVWRQDMAPEAGMLRLVVGLGTRAVNRADDDYARFVPLDHPTLRPEAGTDEQSAYTQHGVDVLDLARNELVTVPFRELAREDLLQCLPLVATRRWAPDGSRGGAGWQLDFERLLRRTDFPQLMQRMLQTLRKAYGQPVDTEFTVNFRPDGDFCLNLLQCRPLQIKRNRARVAAPKGVPADRVIISAHGRFMGGNLDLGISRLIYVDPEAYAALPLSDKYEVARLIGRLNGLIVSQDETPAIVLGPGRWGTSTPSLGVPVSFAEINRAAILCEIAFATGGFKPELSYGTHFFQDLVETGLFYLALSEDDPRTRFDRDFIARAPNSLAALAPEAQRWESSIRIIDTASLKEEIRFHADITRQEVLCWRR